MTRIGTSDLDVFPLALGGNVFGWTADEATSFSILDAFVAGGGNLIDTADVYSAWAPGNRGGESETIIGRWLGARRNRHALTLITKVSQHPEHRGLKRDTIHAAVEASLGRLGTDRIDLYLAHFDDASTPLAETIGAFDELIARGTIRHYGLSNYTAARIEEAIRIARTNGHALPVAIEPHYNLVHRKTYESDIAPIAEREHISTLPYYGLASGFLTGKYTRSEQPAGARAEAVRRYTNEAGFAVVEALQAIAAERREEPATIALAWLVAKPTVAAPIASASKPSQVASLVAAARVALTADELARLDAVSAPFAR